MSWTEDRKQAEWFAGRWARVNKTAMVFETMVEPTAVLAVIGSVLGRQGETEVVVDSAMFPPIKRP